MSSLFDRILNVIQQTNDRCVVIDRAHDTAFVVVPWTAYERMVATTADTPVTHLTSDELLEKINRDVEEWRVANIDGEPQDSLSGAKNEALREDHLTVEPTEQFYFEPIE